MTLATPVEKPTFEKVRADCKNGKQPAYVRVFGGYIVSRATKRRRKCLIDFDLHLSTYNYDLTPETQDRLADDYEDYIRVNFRRSDHRRMFPWHFSKTSIMYEVLVDDAEEWYNKVYETLCDGANLVRLTLDFDFTNTIIETVDFESKCKLLVPDFAKINEELFDWFAKHPEQLQDLNWRQFEKLLNAIFKNQGFHTELGPGSGDGGVDLRLIQKDNIGELLTLVQAKRYKSRYPIGLSAVQALAAAVDDEKANRGLFVTTSRYLPVAERFAERQERRLTLATSKEVAEWCKAVVSRR